MKLWTICKVALFTFFFTLAGNITAMAKQQCEKSALSGIGYARTQIQAEDNASQAWRNNAKDNYGENYQLKESKTVSSLRCNRNRISVRRIVKRRSIDPVTIGVRSRRWICDVTAKPCFNIAENPILDEPDPKIWKRAQKRLLNRNFDYVEIKTITACKNNKLFEMEVIDGKEMFQTKKKLGPCPYGGLEVDEVEKMLKTDGYSYTKLTWNSNKGIFTGKACRNERQYSLKLNRWGEQTQRKDIGECPFGGLSVKEVRVLLSDDGYHKIKFIDRTPPNYRVRACRNGDSYVMNIDRNGTIRGLYTDKHCGSGGYKLLRIRTILQNAEYTDIEFTDRRLPVYVAEACRDGRRLSLRMNRWGKINRQNRIGRCTNGRRRGQGPAWTNAAKTLKRAGYQKIKYRRSASRVHHFTACKGPQKYKLALKHGEIISRKRKGGLGFLECLAN